MTISTQAASILVSGNGVTTSFSVPFVMDSAADITVTSISSNNTSTILSPNSYTLAINPPSTNQIWGIGGTCVYPLSGSPIPATQSLLIQRILPLTQETSVQNQGNYYAQVTEIALDTLEMQIQQIAARTGQNRGTWATTIAYNYGDIVVDGANGASSFNYYMCVIPNTSGTWATDLAAGDWSLLQASTAGAIVPISVNGLTLSAQTIGFTIAGGTTSKTLTVNGNATVSGTNTGDQTITLTGVVTGSGTGSFATSFAPSPTFTGTVNGAAAIWSGNDTASAFIPTGSTKPTNGVYLPASTRVGISCNSALNFVVEGTNTSSNPFFVAGDGSNNCIFGSYGSSLKNLIIANGGSADIQFLTGGGTTLGGTQQLSIFHVAGATRYITLAGSNGSAPILSTSGGNLSLKSSTGLIQFGSSGSFAANGTATITVSNLGPAGITTATIKEWLTIVDSTGTTLYIPAWGA